MKIEYSRNTLKLSENKESFSAKIYTPFDEHYLKTELTTALSRRDVTKMDIALDNIDKILEVTSDKANWSKKNKEYFKIYQAVKEIESPEIQETLDNIFLGIDFNVGKYFYLGLEGNSLVVASLTWWRIALDIIFPDRLEFFYNKLINLNLDALSLPAVAFISDLVKESERLMDIIHGKRLKSKDFT